MLDNPQLFARFGLARAYQRAIAIAVIPAVIYCSAISIADVRNWKTDYELMKAEVDADPNYLAARSSLASLLAYPPDNSQPDNDAALADLNFCIEKLFGNSTPESSYALLADSPAVNRTFQSTSYAAGKSGAYITMLMGDRGPSLGSAWKT